MQILINTLIPKMYTSQIHYQMSKLQGVLFSDQAIGKISKPKFFQ